MKRIEAIIRPEKVPDVCAALEGIGQQGVTISSVQGRDAGQGWTHHVRGTTYRDSVRTRSRVEVAAKDEDAGRVVRAILTAAATGGEADGEIFVHDLAEAIVIRTSERVSAV